MKFLNNSNICLVCFEKPEEDFNLIKHHVSYYPEVIAHVHYMTIQLNSLFNIHLVIQGSFMRSYKMTKKTLTLSIDNKVYYKLQKFKKMNPEFNI